MQLSICHHLSRAHPSTASEVDVDRPVHLLSLSIATLKPTLWPKYFHICTENLLSSHHRKGIVPHGRALGDEQAVDSVAARGDGLVVTVGRWGTHPNAFCDDGLGFYEHNSSSAVTP